MKPLPRSRNKTDLSISIFREGVVILLIIFFLSLQMITTILGTHKFLGPSIAIKNHLKKMIAGKYQERIYLRKKDAFTEIAALLNELSEELEAKQQNSLSKKHPGQQNE